MKTIVFLLIALVVLVASEEHFCPPSHPIQSPTSVHRHQVIACTNGGSEDDKNSLIYKDTDGIWYNLKKKPLKIQPIPSKNKRGDLNPPRPDAPEPTQNENKDGSLNVRRKNKPGDEGDDGTKCPNGYEKPRQHQFPDGNCQKTCKRIDKNNSRLAKYKTYNWTQKTWWPMDGPFVPCPEGQ